MPEKLDKIISDRLRETGWVRIGDVYYSPKKKPKPKKEKPDA